MPEPPRLSSSVPPTDLPVEAVVGLVRRALDDPGHAVLQAPPGAGKTTIVPLRLLDEPWLAGGRIVVLEPRRLAARAAARRMAALLGEDVGATVGYRTRDERRVGRATRVEVVTDGILTRRVQADPSLPGIGLVVFDEIHERNLQGDLALALLLDARQALRPDLRVLAMSATLDTDRVAALLGRAAGGGGPPAPVVSSGGRAHPVDVRWRPPGPRDRPPAAVVAAVGEGLRTDPGDVLVFLAGAADIRRVGAQLTGAVPNDVDVRPLFGALSRDEQDAALDPSPPGRRRVVLATDIAETSLTVDGVRIVVDAGEVRRPRYDPRSGMTRLRTANSSRASAEQRAGRAGRLGPGVAYRLWSAADHQTRAPFAPPEIATVDLAGLALELAVWGSDADQLPFLDPPPAAALQDARRLLVELGAIDAHHRVTATGRAMAELPVHPRLAHMVIRGADDGRARTAAAVAALLEERDVLRGRPDELPTDVTERVRLILDRRLGHPAADRSGLALVRRRATELQRRWPGASRADDADVDDVDDVDDEVDHVDQDDGSACGPVLALAYPDRLAQARGGGRFRLRHGAGAWLPVGDALTGEPFLVVADVGDDGRIRLAAAIDEADLERVAGSAVEDVETLSWDADRDDLRQRVERRLGALVLARREGPAAPGPATVAALIDHVRASGLGALHWTEAARSLRARVGFARRAFGDEWPDLSDPALLATLDEWLVPRLVTAIRRADLERVDVLAAIRDLVGHHRRPELDRLVPPNLVLASGRAVPIDYSGEAPAVAVRVQELFGTTTHPTIAAGRIPLVLHLLSPAGRPVQVTADLPGFWAGSWREVRKDMAGRYPKHPWPADPATASPPPTRGRRPSRG